MSKGSSWVRVRGNAELQVLPSPWPLRRPHDWRTLVNEPQTEAELARLRRALERGQPYGGERSLTATAATLGLESMLRPRGRPRQVADGTEPGA